MTRKKVKIKGNKLSAKILKKEILRLFKRQSNKRFNAKQVIKKLKIANSKDSVNYALDELAEKDELKHIGGGKFRINGKSFTSSPRRSKDRTEHEGKVDMTRTGAAYILVDDLEEDVHVSQKYMNYALHGDKVKIQSWTPSGRRKPEGEVIEVLERGRDHFIGTLAQSTKFSFVKPDKENMPVDIIVFPEKLTILSKIERASRNAPSAFNAIM